MKKISFLLLAIAGLYFFPSCHNNGNNNQNADSMNLGMDSLNQPTAGSGALTSDDTDFMAKAAQGGMMEVQAGKIAVGMGQSQRIRDFGQMMVRDHQKINDDLKQLASDKNVILPDTLSSDQQKDIAKLQKKSGRNFDKEYIKMMVDDHQKDLKAFQKISNNNDENLDLKTFAGNSAMTIQTHLDSAQAIDKDIR